MDARELSPAEERIFEAALRVFARKGKEGARMQEIADAAQINKAMLHYYFRSKDRLYEEVFGYVFERFMRALGVDMRRQETFEQALRLFIDRYVDHVHAHEDVMRLMVNENLAGGPVLRRWVPERINEPGSPPQLFVEKLREAIERGEVRPVDPYQTLLTTISGCLFFLLMYPTVRLVIPAADDREGFIHARKQHLFDLLYNGLRRAESS